MGNYKKKSKQNLESGRIMKDSDNIEYLSDARLENRLINGLIKIRK